MQCERFTHDARTWATLARGWADIDDAEAAARCLEQAERRSVVLLHWRGVAEAALLATHDPARAVRALERAGVGHNPPPFGIEHDWVELMGDVDRTRRVIDRSRSAGVARHLWASLAQTAIRSDTRTVAPHLIRQAEAVIETTADACDAAHLWRIVGDGAAVRRCLARAESLVGRAEDREAVARHWIEDAFDRERAAACVQAGPDTATAVSKDWLEQSLPELCEASPEPPPLAAEVAPSPTPEAPDDLMASAEAALTVEAVIGLAKRLTRAGGEPMEAAEILARADPMKLAAHEARALAEAWIELAGRPDRAQAAIDRFEQSVSEPRDWVSVAVAECWLGLFGDEAAARATLERAREQASSSLDRIRLAPAFLRLLCDEAAAQGLLDRVRSRAGDVDSVANLVSAMHDLFEPHDPTRALALESEWLAERAEDWDRLARLWDHMGDPGHARRCRLEAEARRAP